MRIGELASQLGVSVQTVRFYEQQHLLPTAARTSGGYRQYSARDLEIVQTIKRLQRFGCTLREVRRVLELYHLPGSMSGRTPYSRGSHECLREVVDMGREKLKAINEQINSLIATRDELIAVLGDVEARLQPPRKPPASRRTLRLKPKAKLKAAR